MKVVRVIVSGVLIWALIFIAFTLMSFIPLIKESELQQNLILYILLVPIVFLGATFYYKKGSKTNGFFVGVVMTIIGLIIDTFITVPFVIIPQHGTYSSFFINPLLWITSIEFILIVYFYWKMKVRKT